MQQIYMRTPMPITARKFGEHPVNLLHILRTPFLKNTSGWLLLYIINFIFITVRSNYSIIRCIIISLRIAQSVICFKNYCKINFACRNIFHPFFLSIDNPCEKLTAFFMNPNFTFRTQDLFLFPFSHTCKVELDGVFQQLSC